MDEKEFERELNEFANICGLPNCAKRDFEEYVDYLIVKYCRKQHKEDS